MRLVLPASLCLVIAAPVAAADAAAPAPAWQLGAQGLFAEAEAALPAAAASTEEGRFTRAVLRFNHQPRTDADLAAAAAELGQLAREGSTPELRARSAYFQARAETLRLRAEAPAAVAAWYERLWRDHPDQPYGQRGLVHLVLLAFYGDEPRAAVCARVQALEREAVRLTDPIVQCQFHQVAARGYLQLGGADAPALAHLLAAERLGAARRETRGDLQVSIGRLAADLGQPGIARTHFEAFLRDFPNDPRAYTVRTWLDSLPADAAKP